MSEKEDDDKDNESEKVSKRKPMSAWWRIGITAIITLIVVICIDVFFLGNKPFGMQ